MGISPVRYLVAPVLVAMILVMPVLTVLSNSMAILGGGVFCVLEMHMTLATYLDRIMASLAPWDLFQGLVLSTSPVSSTSCPPSYPAA